ncbi:MAG: cardiolipin synthase [Campylobacterota bacterium]|nr:cardiolipin synthase [Campylobacterota bacterium]
MWMAIIVAIFYILGVLSSINAVMTARTSQGAIAWVVSLITFPFIAVPAYWIFGNSRFNGYVKARHSSHTKVQNGLSKTLEGLEPYHIGDSEISPAGAATEKLADLPLLQRNSVQLLIDGKATFDSILEGIDSATSYILFQFYIVHDDKIGREIKERLITKSKGGVKIYFLYDEIGSFDLSDSYKDDLQKAGVEVNSFHTQKGPGNRFQLNFRNHRKIVVVDGKTAWIGGLNVGDEYLGRDPKVGNWRDTHMKITGPATIAVQVSFVEDWHWTTEMLVPGITWTPTPSSEGNTNVLIIPSGPADELETATLMFLHTINSAKERIWIATPYFVPDDAILAALQLAGLRGVDVRILIPDKADNLLVNLSFYTYLDDASRTGVRFFRYTDGFLHEKVMLIDHTAATVGTANFDNRSFRLNFEITGLVSGPAFAEEIEAMFKDDFARAREMTKSDIDEQSFWFKLITRLARLTSPVQ